MSGSHEVVVPRKEEQRLEFTEASRVTITPSEVRIEPKPRDSDETLAIYRRNVWCFLILVGLSSAWFYRHFETYSQAMIVGVPLTYAIWQVVFSYWKTFWQNNAKELRRKWLSQKATTIQLGGLCAAVLLLLIGTSSIWISLTPGPIESAAFEVSAGGRRFMQRIDLNETSRVGGRLFFPRFLPRRVEFVVTEPKRWEKKGSVLLWPWKSVDLKFPGDFQERPKRALRILPGTSLRDDVGMNGSPYTLTIQEAGTPPRQLSNYRFVTVYVGLAEWDELRASHRQHNTAAWGELLERQFIADGGSPKSAKEYASHWVSRTISARMHDFGDKHTVKVSLGIPGQAPIASMTSEPLTQEITTLTLEKP